VVLIVRRDIIYAFMMVKPGDAIWAFGSTLRSPHW